MRLRSLMAAGCAALALAGTGTGAGAATEPRAAAVPDTMEQRAKACTGCHGDQGRSLPEGYVPRLAGKPGGYLFDQMRAFRDGQRRHDGMARLMENLDDAMLRALANHFAALELPYPPPAVPMPGDAEARRASSIVRQGLSDLDLPACTSCHGTSLTGVNPQVPGLLGLPRDYLVGQIGAWRHQRRHGREPDCMAEVAQRLPADDVAPVADWLAAQPVPADSRPADLPPGPSPRPCAPPILDATTPATPAARTPDAAAYAPTEDGAERPGGDAQVARGAYLAQLGNCSGCHNAAGREDLSGGRGLRTPFGVVHAGNLTPDDATGLGQWSADDFWRALHLGRGRDGRRLVPAFPYTAYTRVSREDSDALHAYLQSLPAVRRARPEHELRFPFGTQAALAVWQWLFFTPSDPAPDTPTPARVPPDDRGGVPHDPDERLARGRYLVNGIGHCLECHAPRNRLGAPGRDARGGDMPGDGWWAPSLHPTPGLTQADLVQLLRDGRNRHGSASGPMASVVFRSTQHWREADLQAAAHYLMSLPPEPATRPAPAAPKPQLALGERLYADRCADCHGRDGEGAPGAYPPLAGNPSVLQADVRNLVRLLKHGAFAAATRGHPRPYGMPPQALEPAEQAAVISYLRQSWGHRASAVSPVDVLVLD